MIRRQRGVSLIEVLVALIIFSIGLLGIAGLQLNSLRFNENASVRGHAVFLAYEMSDRIRARPTDSVGRPLPLTQYNHRMGASAPACAESGCTAPQRDISEWLDGLSRQLPGGQGDVNVSTNGQVTITVRWDESRLNDSATQQFSFVTRFE